MMNLGQITNLKNGIAIMHLGTIPAGACGPNDVIQVKVKDGKFSFKVKKEKKKK